MKYWAIYADYRTKNKYRIPYKIKTIDNIKLSDIKLDFLLKSPNMSVITIVKIDIISSEYIFITY